MYESKLVTLQHWIQLPLTVNEWEELWARDQQSLPFGDPATDSDEEAEEQIKRELDEACDWCKSPTPLSSSLE